ncbi:MAG TPA: rhomboid family intramembrane serine protease [Smithellaceae bacterium]|jgi:rhomboid protease GluP|nr:rhomboid family intramembrane serine protease [Smithellaceae bacterium]HOM69658.1 rhomboid family intramembrane serine protease [Smithellaceae bacterium]HOS08746.1 rhomboid family intramembrane serine protease [Smithellaceae bacterium]HPD49182.1 rhomboid family intramembrane serine protease [Smithellaceae bacterium]HPL49455.1 rhomboid family intramembrane serine protease [Smithellaceae bacterium]
MPAEKKSILCPNCRKLISADEPNCPYCGLARPDLLNMAGIIRKIFALNPILTIIYVNIFFYVVSLLLNPTGIFSGGGFLSFLSPSGQSLFLLGATGTFPVFGFNRYWSLVSASFLHGGIIHLAFNMMALYQLGPFVLHVFGFHRFFSIYILTGIAGFAVSLIFGVNFTIGASASICGLIGAIVYYGKNRGGEFGQAIYKQALGWIIGLIIFGLIFKGINNWAHGGGVISGILLAMLMGYNEKRDETAKQKLLAYVCILVTLGVLIWALLSSVFYTLSRL